MSPPVISPRFPNSAWVKAPRRFVLAGADWTSVAIPVRYGVFDHPTGGRCLIDTGYTHRVTRGPRPLFLRAYAGALRPKLTADALPDAEPKVDTILISHLHADHVSGLKDYPAARLFAHAGGVRHFLEAGVHGRIRHGVFDALLPASMQARITPFESLGVMEAPLGLGPAWDVFDDGSVLAVDLPGHMRGHTGFVFPQGAAPPILYAGDAQWMADAILDDRPPGPPAAWIMDSLEQDRTTRKRIKAFVAGGGRLVLCHDPRPLAPEVA
jgi:glyoxylase-like metal-dependent hydrolase (beta-lactamase superfamily II)